MILPPHLTTFLQNLKKAENRKIHRNFSMNRSISKIEDFMFLVIFYNFQLMLLLKLLNKYYFYSSISTSGNEIVKIVP